MSSRALGAGCLAADGLDSGSEAAWGLAERGGEPGEGAGAARCLRGMFEPDDSGQADPRLPGQVGLGQPGLAA
jgi:hypothetical protein